MGRLSREAQASRLTEAKALLAQGVTVRDLSARWRIDVPAAQGWLMRNLDGYAPKAKRNHHKGQSYKMYGNEPKWQTADPGTLTADQLTHALKMGIKPARYAWLLQCPRGGRLSA